MKLKIKNFEWLAGKPVVILNDKTAKQMNVFVDDRIVIEGNEQKVYAIVDFFPKLVRKKQIGVSQELSKILKLKNGSKVEVNTSELSKASFLIKKKIEGKCLDKEEMEYLVSEIVNNGLNDAEIAYFTAAQKLNKMSIKEIIDLTKAMVKTGAKLTFKGKRVADKHCIGGIAGNRTTPITIAICAAAGLTIPKTSSRAITSASGTADVIETISNVKLSLPKLKKVVKKTNACLVWGGSLGLAPSDDKIIQVERILNLDIESQLLASIMSKKISVSAKYLLIDIPYGVGAKVKTLQKAKKLGKQFKKIAKYFRIKLKVIYSDGSQPIGDGFGPVLEMQDVLAVLQNRGPVDLKQKSLTLAIELMKLCGIKNPKKKAKEILSSGKAYKKFKEIINEQNEKKNFDFKIRQLKLAKFKKTIKAKKNGEIIRIDNKGINSLCRILGTPETISAGAYLHKHLNKIKKGEPMITLYSENKKKLKSGIKFVKEFKPIKIK